MMTADATDLLRSGDVSGALTALQDKIRKNAADPKLRIFLFQLLCVMGDWKRAIAQLKLCAELDPLAIPMAQTYREAIICEVYREKVFAGEKDPLIFGEPLPWVALMIAANRALAQGDPAAAADLRDRAFAAVPDATGSVNGERFDWIADADMRLGPLLEIIVNGRYFWMPFSAIDTLTVDPPADLRDTVWTAASLKLANGGSTVALIPTRYVGTTSTGDGSAMLARTTTWADAGGEAQIGTGQRLLATDTGDTAIMDLRSLVMDRVPTDG